MMRGILAKLLVLHTRDEGIVVIPSGTQIDVVSDDCSPDDVPNIDLDGQPLN